MLLACRSSPTLTLITFQHTQRKFPNTPPIVMCCSHRLYTCFDQHPKEAAGAWGLGAQPLPGCTCHLLHRPNAFYEHQSMLRSPRNPPSALLACKFVLTNTPRKLLGVWGPPSPSMATLDQHHREYPQHPKAVSSTTLCHKPKGFLCYSPSTQIFTDQHPKEAAGRRGASVKQDAAPGSCSAPEPCGTAGKPHAAAGAC